MVTNYSIQSVFSWSRQGHEAKRAGSCEQGALNGGVTFNRVIQQGREYITRNRPCQAMEKKCSIQRKQQMQRPRGGS